MTKSLSKIRISAFDRQHGRCFYCVLPMWKDDAKSFAVRYKITVDQAKQFQCTAEHLHARQDGGKNTSANIVAACIFCNRQRHKRKAAPSPEQHKQRVQARMANKRWHSKAVHTSGLTAPD
jgi:5-methylcytosine-specific restriction endonuclease McrA